jgi:LysR family glycine cleavage system transcriptional activator
MARRLPPFAAVRAFEAAARHLSMTAAGEELCVTASAISHQVRLLESFLATALFEREGNRLRLTAPGRAYQGRLTGLLDALEDSARDLAPPRELRVLSTPGFAARFLVPRLGRFADADRLRLRIAEGAPSTDFACNDADVVIQWSDAPVPGVAVVPLMRSGRYPVISPALKAAAGVRRPGDLLRLTLFHDEVMDGWPDWFRAAGLPVPTLPRGPRFAHCELSSTAAERGQGVALAYGAVIRDTLRGGSLVRLFETVTLPVTIYSVACAAPRAGEPLIAAFRDWLLAEVAADGSAATPPRAAAE